MYTLVIGETQFSITAQDAATYLNADNTEASTTNPHFIRGRVINPRMTKDVAIYAPAMQNASTTLSQLRDNGYRA